MQYRESPLKLFEKKGRIIWWVKVILERAMLGFGEAAQLRRETEAPPMDEARVLVLLSRYFPPVRKLRRGELLPVSSRRSAGSFRDELHYRSPSRCRISSAAAPFSSLASTISSGRRAVSAGIFLDAGFHPGFLASADQMMRSSRLLVLPEYSSGISTSGALLQSSSRL